MALPLPRVHPAGVQADRAIRMLEPASWLLMALGVVVVATRGWIRTIETSPERAVLAVLGATPLRSTRALVLEGLMVLSAAVACGQVLLRAAGAWAPDSPLGRVAALALDRSFLTIAGPFAIGAVAIVVTAAPDESIKMSQRNLKNVKWLPASYLNVLDLLSHRGLLMTEDAVRAAEALWGGERAKTRRAPAKEAAGA